MRLAPAFLALLLAGTANAAPPPSADARKPDPAVADGIAKPPVEEQAKTTAHSIAVGGRTLAYHATAGTVTIRDTEGKPTGSVFYVAYTLDGGKGVGDMKRRPVTFFYNGGPGSATLWLHMGSFAPMRIQTANPEYIKPAPYNFGPNPDTLLDTTDMVFIDAMGTGYSRPLGDAKNSDFWGVDQDVDMFAKAIMRYVSINGRWNSPKFLFGESYGTTRSGALAYELGDRGMALNGVVLLSSIMNYGIRQPGFDQIYLGYLPSFAATAWYHNKIANRPADVATSCRRRAISRSGPMPRRWPRARTSRRRKSIRSPRGCPVSPACRPTISSNRTCASASAASARRCCAISGCRSPRMIHAIPASMPTPPPTAPNSTRPTPPSRARSWRRSAIIWCAISATKPTCPIARARSRSKGFKWDNNHRPAGARYPQPVPDTAIDLSAAMRTNPYLKVLSANGYYDMATPFFSTEYDLSHMLLSGDQAKNLEFRYYPSGHMVYLNPDALHALKRDVADFMNRAVAQSASGQPATRPTMSDAGATGPNGPN